MSTVTTKSKGDALELRVANLLKKEGRWRVKHNVTLKDANGNRSQIDVVYGLLPPLRTYVECKAYSAENKVPLEDVAKFKEVLALNGISPARGLFITTSDYTPRALTTGIKTLDGKQLKEWERRVKGRANKLLVFKLAAALLAFATGCLIGLATPARLAAVQAAQLPPWVGVMLPRGVAATVFGKAAEVRGEIRRQWDQSNLIEQGKKKLEDLIGGR
jgi:Restriction endonuclease